MRNLQIITSNSSAFFLMIRNCGLFVSFVSYNRWSQYKSLFNDVPEILIRVLYNVTCTKHVFHFKIIRPNIPPPFTYVSNKLFCTGDSFNLMSISRSLPYNKGICHLLIKFVFLVCEIVFHLFYCEFETYFLWFKHAVTVYFEQNFNILERHSIDKNGDHVVSCLSICQFCPWFMSAAILSGPTRPTRPRQCP